MSRDVYLRHHGDSNGLEQGTSTQSTFHNVCSQYFLRFGTVLGAWREKRLEMAFPMLPMLKIRTL
jgi:hypothetical protein